MNDAKPNFESFQYFLTLFYCIVSGFLESAKKRTEFFSEG